jgi:hypothetical protein
MSLSAKPQARFHNPKVGGSSPPLLPTFSNHFKDLQPTRQAIVSLASRFSGERWERIFPHDRIAIELVHFLQPHRYKTHHLQFGTNELTAEVASTNPKVGNSGPAPATNNINSLRARTSRARVRKPQGRKKAFLQRTRD